MKRRLVRHGPSTLIVSLPAEWVKRQGLQEKDEVEIIPQENQLIIATEKLKKKESIQVDITLFDRTSIVLLLQAIYRAGFTQATLSFSQPETTHYRTKRKLSYSTIIHSLMDRFIGFEIINEKENFIDIAQVSSIDSEEIETMTSRMFLLLQNTVTSFCEALREGNSATMELIEHQHDTITKHLSYLLRAISQGNYAPDKSALAFTHILANTDKIIDILKYIARERVGTQKPLPKNMHPLLAILDSSVRAYVSLVRRYDQKIVAQISYNRDSFKHSLQSIKPRLSTPEYIVGIQLLPLLELLYDLLEWRIHLQLVSDLPDESARYESAGHARR